MGDRLVRCWASIEPIPGVIVADVRDVPVGPNVGEMLYGDPARRGWMLSVVDDKGRATCRDGKRLDCGCRPGKPCAHAHATAARWWGEWQRRNAARFWRAHTPNPQPDSYSTKDWSPDRRATREEAEADARRLGLAFVVLLNGQADEFERHEVPRV